MWRKRPARHVSLSLLKPVIDEVYIAPKVDQPLHRQFWPRTKTSSRNDHHRPARIIRGDLKQLTRTLAIKMIGLAVMPDRQQQLVPRLNSARKKWHEVMPVIERSLRLRMLSEQPNRTPDVARQTIAVGAHRTRWPDLPTDRSLGLARKGQLIRRRHVLKPKPMSRGISSLLEQGSASTLIE